MTKEDGMFGLSLGAANSVANWTYLISGGGAVFFTALTVVASFAMWKTSTLIEAEKDRQLEWFKADSAERVALLQKETKDAQLQLEAERANRLKLQESLSSRHLSPERSAALSNGVRGTAGSVQMVFTSDAESLAFAQDIANALVNGGVQVSTTVIGSMSPKPYGITIYVNSATHPLIAAMRDAEVAFEIKIAPAETPSILVGEKPPPF